MTEGITGVMDYWDTQSQKLNFETSILEIDGKWLNLDKNLFYPEGGGQPGDTGVLRLKNQEVKINDTQLKDGKIWLLATNNHAFSAGDSVFASIDKTRRFTLSRNHSGQHLLSAAFYEINNADTTRADLNLLENQLDLDRKLSLSEISKTLQTTLSLVSDNLSINSRIILPSKIEGLKIRGGIEHVGLKGMYRLVQIGEDDKPFDRNLCGGTHVASTAEILAITISGIEGKKIRFICGSDALKQLAEDTMHQKIVMRMLSANRINYEEKIAHLIESNSVLTKQNQKLQKQAFLHQYEKAKWDIGHEFKLKKFTHQEGNRGFVAPMIAGLANDELIFVHFISDIFILASGSENVVQKAFSRLQKSGVKGGGKGNFLMGKSNEPQKIIELLKSK